MTVNQKAVKVLNKVFEAGFTDEKAIAAMTMDDILSMQGITVADIGLINDLQRASRRTRSFPFWAVVRNEYRAYQPHHREERRRVFIFPQLQRHRPVSLVALQGAFGGLCRRGTKGLDREIIRMLYEYAELRGTHKSLERYRYAKDTPEARAIYKRYTDQIDARYEQMDKADQDSVWRKPTEKAKEYRAFERDMQEKCIRKSPQGAGNMTRNTETETMNDKEV